MCPYQFYKEEEKYYPRLYCKIKENTMNPYCVYSKRCDKERKYILLDNSDNCNIMEEAKKLNIPKDAYYVRTYKQRANGTYSLYVDINGTVEKINTVFTNFNQDYIYLDKVDSVYIPSLTPIKKTTKRKNSGKTKNS